MIRAFLAAISLAASVAPVAVAQSPRSLQFGAYDPGGVFSNDPNLEIEHVYLPWRDVDLSSLYDVDTYARKRGRSLLVTIEPWSWEPSVRGTSDQLQVDILVGRHDSRMKATCRILGDLSSYVTVRFAHEMDDRSGQFIWAHWEPDAYAEAYRRMIGVCKAVAPHLRYMWSPLGFDTLQAYYPGDDYVDVIGLSVFGLQNYDRSVFGRDRGFQDVFAPAYELADNFGKPIVIAELGYLGDAAYVAAWDAAVRRAQSDFPALVGIVYFHDREVYPWPDGFDRPDWRERGDRINAVLTGEAR